LLAKTAAQGREETFWSSAEISADERQVAVRKLLGSVAGHTFILFGPGSRLRENAEPVFGKLTVLSEF
jgi:hypothetical protein